MSARTTGVAPGTERGDTARFPQCLPFHNFQNLSPAGRSWTTSFIFPSFRGGRSVILFRMSAQEIIAELAKLKPEELRLVKEKLNRLNAESPIPQTGWGRALSEMAGKADDLLADLPPARSLPLRNAEA